MSENRSERYFMLIFVLAITSSFAPLSIDFFAPSMPNATRDLAVSADAIQNSLYIFFIGYGLSPFLWGVLTDRFGRRSILLIGIAVYLTGTFGCYFSQGIYELSAMRLLQGVGAASGVIVARATLRDIHGPSGATKAISGMFLIMVWVPILGPMIGGFIASSLNWRVSFLVMALIAGLTLLGGTIWQRETFAVRVPEDKGEKNRLSSVLLNPAFAKHSLANMFCVGTMLLFIANFSYLAEQYYQLSANNRGPVLALFNASISAGVYIVRLCAPRIGVEKTIHAGLWVSLIGWLMLWLVCLRGTPAPLLLLIPIIFACLGTGMVISLSAGQALVPFSYGVGVASALYICIQSAGSSLISFLVTLFFESSLISTATALVVCSILAMISMRIGKKGVT